METLFERLLFGGEGAKGGHACCRDEYKDDVNIDIDRM